MGDACTVDQHVDVAIVRHTLQYSASNILVTDVPSYRVHFLFEKGAVESKRTRFLHSRLLRMVINKY